MNWVMWTVLAGGACSVMFGAAVLRNRGEESGVPEEPVPAVSLEDARAALDEVLADDEETMRRFEAMAEQEPVLRHVARRLAPSGSRRRWPW